MSNAALLAVETATAHFDWSVLHGAPNGTGYAAVLDGSIVTVEKVHSNSHNDEDYNDDLSVVIRVGDDYYRKDGYANVGSHCYGEYGPEWNSGLKRVRPKVQPTTVWVDAAE